MGALITWACVAVYAIATTFLAAQGLHSSWLLARFLRHRRSAVRRAPLRGDDVPIVLVQLPVYDERDVVERLVAAVGAFDWPAAKLRIQLLDDGSDDSVERGARAIAALRARGLDALHVHSGDRTGFKAGALAYGLALDDRAPGGAAPFVAIFDADFVPAPDFLRRTLPYALADEQCAFVQARWDHCNADVSSLTRAQALGIDGHFAIEQAARAWSGLALNFNGTCGVWRRRAIDDSGGWQHDTLTEDLDLSYRAHLRGHRAAFAVDVAVPGELPPTLEAWRAQQFRWAKGSLQTAKKLLPAVLRSPWSASRKIGAALHLTHYLVHPAILVSLLAAPFAARGLRELPALALGCGVVLLVAGLVPPLLLYAASQRVLARSFTRLAALPALMSLGTGLALSNSRAAWQALRGEASAFVRTPKNGDGRGSYRAAPAAGLGELLVGAIGLLGCAGVFVSRSWWLMPAVAVYVLGFVVQGAWLLRNRLALAAEVDTRPARSWWPLASLGTVAIGAMSGIAWLAADGVVWRAAPATFAGLGAVLGACCFLAAHHLQRARTSRGHWIVGLGTAVLLHALATALPTSDDVQRYVVEGAQRLAGQDPYTIAPAEAALPGVPVGGVNHAHMTSIYPPLMLAVHEAVVAAWCDPAAFRLLAIVAVAVLALTAVGLGLARGRPAVVPVAILWNPVLVLFATGEAHHDVVAAALLAAGLTAVAHRHERIGVLVVAAAALAKPFVVVALPFVLRATRWRNAWLAVGAAAVAYAPFVAAGSGLFASLVTFGGSMQFHGALEPLVRNVVAAIVPTQVVGPVVRVVLIAAFAVAFVWLWRRSRGQSLETVVARALALLLLCLPTLHPWYFTALVALLPFVGTGALMAWTVAAPLYWLHGTVMPVGEAWAECSWVTTAAHVPFVAWMLIEAFGPPRLRPWFVPAASAEGRA